MTLDRIKASDEDSFDDDYENDSDEDYDCD